MLPHELSRNSLMQAVGSLRGERVIFCPNFGNAGDSVIAAATFQILDDHGVEYMTTRHTDLGRNFDNRVIIYGGGGNLVPLYEHAEKFIRAYHKDAKKLIIFPHTVVGNDNLLAELNSNVVVITRERMSYEHVMAHARRASASDSRRRFRAGPE